jgi:hypothetical protein
LDQHGRPNLDDGSIERADLDGGIAESLSRKASHTPKQIHLDKDSSKLYWCDREGMQVMRANLDGSHVRNAGRDRPRRQGSARSDPVVRRITIDPKLGKIYWTQKGPTKGGLGRLCRANIDIANGESPANRSDIEVLFDQLPEPIDLELDLANRVLYWTDRGDPPAATPSIAHRSTKAVPEILITHLMEGIGIALDVPATGCSSPTSPVRSIPPISMEERAQLPLRPGQSHWHRLCRNQQTHRRMT